MKTKEEIYVIQCDKCNRVLNKDFTTELIKKHGEKERQKALKKAREKIQMFFEEKNRFPKHKNRKIRNLNNEELLIFRRGDCEKLKEGLR